MDTKWRNRAALFVYSLVFVIGLSGPLTLIAAGGDYMYRDYYNTPKFRSELERFTSYLSLFELNGVAEERAKSSIEVGEDEIAEYRSGLGDYIYLLQSVKDEYEIRIQDALRDKNEEAFNFYTAERDGKIEDVTKSFKDDEYVRSKLAKEKEKEIEAYYEERETFRAEYLNLKEQYDYYFINMETGSMYTNLGETVIDEQSANFVMETRKEVYTTSYSVDSNQSYHYWISNHILLPSDTFDPYAGRIAVPSKSAVIQEAERYRYEQIGCLIYVLAGIAALVFSLYRFRKVKALPAEEGSRTAVYDKLPVDAKGFLFLATGLCAIGLVFALPGSLLNTVQYSWAAGGRELILIAIAAAACWAATMMQARLIAASRYDIDKLKQEWRRALLSRAWTYIKSRTRQTLDSSKDAFIFKSTGVQLVVLLLVLFGLGLAGSLPIGLLWIEEDFVPMLVYGGLLVIVGLPVVIALMNKVGYLNRVAKAAEELAAGRSPGEELPVSGASTIARLAANMNVLKQGVSMMQNEQARSERLKTELITNVSHDLRTPLTSIITYIGLLKAENVTSGDRLAYVDIIDQKSKRLKVLIDDLFEVSKMASGNVELTMAKADLVQLLHQALAEYEDVIDGSNVQFRVSAPETPVYALVDGQKLWRVFDNLIGNMTKYSLDHSRAYITIHASDAGEALVAFKNVSKYEVGGSGEELLERFKRGDTSRHTEGSGLGLAIAKSIVDLHEGRMTIETDGDLFKVIIALRLEP